MTQADKLEQAVRLAFEGSTWAARGDMIAGHAVRCEASRAMINRGTATGTACRINWTIDGKRASRAAVAALERDA